MIILPALALWSLLQAQSDPARQARELVGQLRSESFDERQEATRKLKVLGRAALPELEKAAKDPDAEVAERARNLLRVIPVREVLSTRFSEVIPGVEERLAFGDEHTWTKVLLEVTGG